jgi:hypothetical protein
MPDALKLIIEQKLRFKCIILENAIIFFISKYLKEAQEAKVIPIKDRERAKEAKNNKDK